MLCFELPWVHGGALDSYRLDSVILGKIFPSVFFFFLSPRRPSRQQANEGASGARDSDPATSAVKPSRGIGIPRSVLWSVFIVRSGEDRGEGQSKSAETNEPPHPGPPSDGGEGVFWFRLRRPARDAPYLGIRR